MASNIKTGKSGRLPSFLRKNPVAGWPGVGSRDQVHYYSGWVMQRDFVGWIDGSGNDLTIGREGGRKSFVSWRITEGPEKLSTLSITIYPYVLQTIPAALRWIPHHVFLQPSLRNYLEVVVKGFEWFITTGKPVQKNQFGKHNWFSP